MTLKELLNEVNPQGYKKQEVCNNELKFLVSLYAQKMYNKSINSIRFLVAKKCSEAPKKKKYVIAPKIFEFPKMEAKIKILSQKKLQNFQYK